jgi:hypothetical protein
MAFFRKTKEGLETVEPIKNPGGKKILREIRRINETRFNLDEYKLTEKEKEKIKDDLDKREEETFNKLDDIES